MHFSLFGQLFSRTALAATLSCTLLAASRANGAVLVDETFAHPDGPLQGKAPAIGGAWAPHSADGTNDVQVASGQARLNQPGSGEDIHIDFANGPIGPGSVIYSAFDLTVPTVEGPVSNVYFAHFKDSGTFNFGARVWITAPTSSGFRLALSNDNSLTDNDGEVFWSADLAFDTTYRVVTAYGFNYGTTSMWVNPVHQLSPLVTAGDVVPNNFFEDYSLRQSTANSVQLIDNLRVATTFDEARGGASSPKYQFATIDYPGSTASEANGINAAGQITGTYADAGGIYHAFVFDGNAYASFDAPDATNYSSANGMNAAGQVVGLYNAAGGVTQAYLRDGSTFTNLVPLADSPFTQALSINDAGDVVGSFVDQFDAPHGFYFDGDEYVTLTAPNATLTAAIGINNAGVIVGTYIAGGSQHGFLLEDGAYLPIDVPGARSTIAEGINDSGQIVGLYEDAQGFNHGFVYSAGVYTPLDMPGELQTQAFAVNNSGEIVGIYLDAGGLTHGFRASPIVAIAAADFDGDDNVDGDDLTLWTANYGREVGAAKSDGDADADGDVDGGDFLIWQRQLHPANPATAAVPEPCTWSLAAVALAAVAGRRRRGSRI